MEFAHFMFNLLLGMEYSEFIVRLRLAHSECQYSTIFSMYISQISLAVFMFE